MMSGYLKSKGLKIGEERTGLILKEINPAHQSVRQNGARNLNPVPYTAAYFRHKLHMDQNEKCVMFGLTHVIAVDGYSGMIVAYKSMPTKNNLTIYEDVYRSAVLKYGMWDQVRVDHGTEFYLTLFMQEQLQQMRINRGRAPYLQTQSKMNHCVERLWVEVNNRINYPIKSALIEMCDNDLIDINDNITRYCVSSVCLKLSEIGMARVVGSWNSHRIPGKGVPFDLAREIVWEPLCATDIPCALVASEMYYQTVGSQLANEYSFCRSPFQNQEHQDAVETEYAVNNIPMGSLFSNVVNGNNIPLQTAVLNLIDTTKRHCL